MLGNMWKMKADLKKHHSSEHQQLLHQEMEFKDEALWELNVEGEAANDPLVYVSTYSLEITLVYFFP